MKVRKWLSLLALLALSQVVMAGAGGDIILQNQTPYTFKQTNVFKHCISELASPSLLTPGSQSTIYLEFDCDVSAELSLEYSVDCLDGQTDKFQIAVYREWPSNGHARIAVTRIGTNLHCINLDGNDGLTWLWNEFNRPAPLIVINPAA